MTFAELIAQLQTFPPDQRVLVNNDYCFRNPDPIATKVHSRVDDGDVGKCYQTPECEECVLGVPVSSVVEL